MQVASLGKVHTTDVLVIGGGTAGLNAAISARERGQNCLVVDKAHPIRSGSIGGGVDHFMSYLETGPAWDTREGFLQWVGQIAKGAVDLKVHNATFCCGGRDEMFERMARIGTPLQQPDGSFYRTQSYGAPGPIWINFNGKNLKPNLYKEARRKGTKMLTHVVVTDLLTHEGRIVGCVGVGVKDGAFHIVRAKTTLLATGNTNRIYKNPTGLRFNTWLCPANTGAAQAMAFRAGAELTNMEYMRWTVVPKGLAAAGLNALMGMGGKFINASGEEFMYRYHPQGDRGPRSKLVEGVYLEIIEGRGPIYIDCRHLDPEELSHLRTTLGYDKDTLPDFIMAKGLDLTKDLLPVHFSEGMQCGPAEVVSSGIKIDEQAKSNVPGLFAAGDCADQHRCFHLSMVGGSHAGRWAAHHAEELPECLPLSYEQVADAKAFTMRPLEIADGPEPEEVELAIADLMWNHCGPVRTEKSLLQARALLDALKAKVDGIHARDHHQLLRAHEVKTMWEVGKVAVSASLYRKESRFGVYFNRKDHPETKAEWCGLVCVSRGDANGHAVRFQPLDYEIPPVVDSWPPSIETTAA